MSKSKNTDIGRKDYCPGCMRNNLRRLREMSQLAWAYAKEDDYESPCTFYDDFTRKEFIAMFNKTLEFYGHKRIIEVKK